MLASILNSPSALDPAVDKDNAAPLLERYRYVLGGMVDMGSLDPDLAARYERRLPPFPVQEVKNRLGGPKGYVLALVEKELRAEGLSDEEIYGGGLRITTHRRLAGPERHQGSDP